MNVLALLVPTAVDVATEWMAILVREHQFALNPHQSSAPIRTYPHQSALHVWKGFWAQGVRNAVKAIHSSLNCIKSTYNTAPTTARTISHHVFSSGSQLRISALSGQEGTLPVRFVVAQTEPIQTPFSVRYSIKALTASFDDIERISGTLHFTGAQDEAFEVMVRLVEDTNFNEGSEEFALVITYEDERADIDNITTVATIFDSDQGTVGHVVSTKLHAF
jgi:hypothetical protein